jgi:hypothetical protein
MFLSILIPILLAGTLKLGKISLWSLVFNVLTAIVKPLILHHRLTVAKFARMKILEQNDMKLALRYNEICTAIQKIQNELNKHARLQLSIETIYQLAGSIILLCLGNSHTRTTQGLSAMFMQDEIVLMNIKISSNFVLGTFMAMNLTSFVKVHINGIVQEYSSNTKMAGKLMLILSILLGSLIRISSILLYFSPILGLFQLLHHYQGMYLSGSTDFKNCLSNISFFSISQLKCLALKYLILPIL